MSYCVDASLNLFAYLIRFSGAEEGEGEDGLN